MKRICVSNVTALALPFALGAQQPTASAPQPPANPISQSFRIVAAHYGGWLVAAFDSIPAGKYRYKPTPVQQTIGYIAQHLEEANYEECPHFGPLKAPMEVGDSLVADSTKATWPKDKACRATQEVARVLRQRDSQNGRRKPG